MMKLALHEAWLILSVGKWGNEKPYADVEKILDKVDESWFQSEIEKRLLQNAVTLLAHRLEYRGRWAKSEDDLTAAWEMMQRAIKYRPEKTELLFRLVGIGCSMHRLGLQVPEISDVSSLNQPSEHDGYQPANYMQAINMEMLNPDLKKIRQLHAVMSKEANDRSEPGRSTYDVDLFHEQVLMAETPIDEKLRQESIGALSRSTSFTSDLNPNSPLRVVACRFRGVIEQAGGDPPDLPGPPECAELLEMYECFRQEPDQAWARCFY